MVSSVQTSFSVRLKLSQPKGGKKNLHLQKTNQPQPKKAVAINGAVSSCIIALTLAYFCWNWRDGGSFPSLTPLSRGIRLKAPCNQSCNSSHVLQTASSVEEAGGSTFLTSCLGGLHLEFEKWLVWEGRTRSSNGKWGHHLWVYWFAIMASVGPDCWAHLR